MQLWTIENGFVVGVARGLMGAHGALLQVTIFWGALGLFTYLWIVWCVYHSIPSRCGCDELSLALLGVLVSLGLLMLETHSFYDKWFAFGIGMLVGAQQWIWRTGIVTAVEANKCPPHAQNSVNTVHGRLTPSSNN
jgi:hypothetical protein